MSFSELQLEGDVEMRERLAWPTVWAAASVASGMMGLKEQYYKWDLSMNFWKFIKSVRKAMTRKSWKADTENYSTGIAFMAFLRLLQFNVIASLRFNKGKIKFLNKDK